MANRSPPPPPADRNELEAAQKFLEQAAIENLVSVQRGAPVPAGWHRERGEAEQVAASSELPGLAGAWMEKSGLL